LRAELYTHLVMEDLYLLSSHGHQAWMISHIVLVFPEICMPIIHIMTMHLKLLPP